MKKEKKVIIFGKEATMQSTVNNIRWFNPYKKIIKLWLK